NDSKLKCTGSMTVAGIASIAILNQMLLVPHEELSGGEANCCGESADDLPIQRGIALLGQEGNFSVRSNPGTHEYWIYYLCGLERAGRLTGTRFFGQHDWYREGAHALLARQERGGGSWHEIDDDKDGKSAVVATSMALLFLAKGLAPVLIQKLQYGHGAR